jgi:signal transduction histidine kinase
VRWRLFLLIAIPTITALVFGGLRIDTAARSAVVYQHVGQLATLGTDVSHLAQAMEDERDTLAGYIGAGRLGTDTSTVSTVPERTTDMWAAKVRALASGIGGAYATQTQNDAAAVLGRIADLPRLRASAFAPSNLPSLILIEDYTQAISDLFAFEDQIAQGSSDPTLQASVRAFGSMARVEDQATAQRGLLYSAIVAGQFPPGSLNVLNGAVAQQQADFAQFASAATLPEAQFYNDTVTGPCVDGAATLESFSAQLGAQNQNLGALSAANANPSASSCPSIAVGASAAVPSSSSVASTWYVEMSDTINKMRTVESQLLGSITAQSRTLRSAATRSALLSGIAVLAILILVLLITTFVARSMVGPLRRLRADALEVAGTRLPEMVRRLSEADGVEEGLDIEPINVDSTDEIGEVARAFDQVHREAVRLAANEALLRGNLNAMFVNLSRRSQSLIERQIALIDSLEQGEQDSERLSSLFRLDHLATRMRRNSENLLVLAGHEVSRRWSQPVALVDVLRAAISEIEQYERVVLNVQPGVAVVGHAVNDVVHLVAEIVENATTFSSEDTQVYVSGHPLTSGGVLLDITDSGVGITDQEMAHANWRLDNPPVVDVAVSRRMGLFVVGRLAARHGIRVRLRHAPSGGLTTLIWLPETIAAQEAAAPIGRLRRFEVEEHGQPVPSLSAPTPTDVATMPRPTISTITGAAAAQAAAAARVPKFSQSEPVSNGPSPVISNNNNNNQVTVPPAALSGGEQRLPIFDSLESDWFRRHGTGLETPDSRGLPGKPGKPGKPAWSSPADEGWHAAEVVVAPAAGPTTSSGLPRRVPRANLVPGSVGGQPAESQGPSRSAESVRSRMTSFQQGVRDARAAATQTEEPPET